MLTRQLNTYQIFRKFLSSATNVPLAKSNIGLTDQHIREVVRKQPQLRDYDPARWHSTFDLLSQQGFTATSFVSIISNHPSLLNRQPIQILQTLECWRGTQFGDQKVISLLEQYPELFDLREEHSLTARVTYLKSYALTGKNIWRLFMNAPNLITDNETTIDPKIAYIRNVMRAEVSDVVKSTVFSHSLESIQCRHVFLDRLGMYKPRSPKANPLEPNKNPRMHLIYDTSDQAFASKICGVSPDEFEVFQKLFAVEVEKGKFSFDEDAFN